MKYRATLVKIQIGTTQGQRLNLSLSAVGKSGGGYRARWQTQSFKLAGTTKRWTSSDRDSAEDALAQWTNLHAAELDEVTLQRIDDILQRSGTARNTHSTGRDDNFGNKEVMHQLASSDEEQTDGEPGQAAAAGGAAEGTGEPVRAQEEEAQGPLLPQVGP